jgi:hypothetical protein
MPARTSELMTVSGFEAGPNVQTILVFENTRFIVAMGSL